MNGANRGAIASIVAGAALTAAGCGGSSGVACGNKDARCYTAAEVERAFAAAGLPLRERPSIDLSTVPSQYISRMKDVSPAHQLGLRSPLPGQRLVLVVGGRDSGKDTSESSSATQELGSGKTVSPSPGEFDELRNVAVASKLDFSTFDRLGNALDTLDKG